MFIRKRHNKSGSTSIQIVQKFGTSLKILKHIGTATNLEDISVLIAEANKLITSQNLSLFQPTINIDEIQIAATKLIGFHEVFGHIFDLIGYGNIIEEKLLRDLVIARVAKPTSKLGTFRWLKEKVRIEQIKKRLTKKSKITKTKLGKIGRSKYLIVDGEAEVSINYESIRADELWDGLKGYLTNIPRVQLSANEVIQKYSELWQVEKAFRVSKSDLGIRPIYHYKRENTNTYIDSIHEFSD